MFKVIKMSDNTKEFLETYYRIFDDMKRKMEAVEIGSSIAQNYINRLIPLHEAGIEMAQNILKYTTDVEIETLAKAIITGDSIQIQKLRELAEICMDEASERDLYLYEKGYNDAYNKMVREMGNATSGNNINADFLYQMIPHHEGSLNINKNLLRFEVCEQLRTLVEEAVMEQQMQLDQMRGMLRKY